MALKIIGSGLGRTGTMSMKRALEQLGFGPCHHMVEVFAHPESVPLWIEAGAGRGDWDEIFKDYNAMVDYPGCRYWRELAQHWPDAKVLHTVRDPDTWFDSTQATIFAPGSFADAPPEPLKPFFESISGAFGGHLHDRDFMTDYFRRHTAEVVATIPPERLLVYEVGEGWERLCAFLGVPVPDTPYPSENTRAQFQDRVRARAANPDAPLKSAAAS
ncbi:MAG TPA: sulfotransferase [Caulobacteraceae bacterium]